MAGRFRLTVWLAVTLLALSPCCANAQQPVANLPAAEDLLERYRQRCRAEIRALAASLDELNAKLEKTVLNGGNPSPLKRAELGWRSGPEARRLYRALLTVPDKYLAWAVDAKLPPWFDTPKSLVDEALRDQRWPALRALLLPISWPDTQLGWDHPERDPLAWQSDDARAYEWFLLLKWLEAAPVDAHGFQRNWVLREVGANHVLGWQKLLGRSRAFFHEEYQYVELLPPNLNGASVWTKAMVHQLCWQSGPRNASLFDFSQRRDGLLIDLLTLVVAEKGSEPTAANWFMCGARWFPCLTALQPVKRGDGLCVLTARDPQHRFPFPLVADMQAGCSSLELRNAITGAIYWYQIDRMQPSGEWQAPIHGWSTLTLRIPVLGLRVEPKSAPRTSKHNRAADPAPAPVRAEWIGAERAWRHICLWVGQTLASDLELPKNAAVSVGVANACGGWHFAFGVEELVEVLAEQRPELGGLVADGAAGASVHYRVEVVGVKPHEAVTIRVRVDSRTLDEREFAVHGFIDANSSESRWPLWFAATMRPRLELYLLFPLLTLAGLLGRILWRLRRAGFASSLPWERCGSAVAFAATVPVLLLSQAPTPHAVGQVGGTVEFVVPMDGAVPPGVRDLANESCVEVFRELARQTRDPDAGVDDSGTGPRYWTTLPALMTPRFLPSPNPPAPTFAPFPLIETEFRVTGYAWGRPADVIAGRVRPGDLRALRAALERLNYSGERDLPDSMRSGAAASFVFAITDGDHGSLTAPSKLAAPTCPIFAVCPVTPSRDANDERGTSIKTRVAWVSEHSTKAVCLFPDFTHKDTRREATWRHDSFIRKADQCGASAQDMHALREQWWPTSGLDDRQRTVAAALARDAVEHFKRQRGATSRTVLHLVYEPWRAVLLMLLATAYSVPPLLLCRPTVGCGFGVGANLTRLGAATLLMLAATPLALLCNQHVWVYGGSLLEGLHVAVWWCVGGAVLAAVLLVIGWIVVLHRPRKSFGFVVLDYDLKPARVTWTDRMRSSIWPICQAGGLALLAIGVACLLVGPVLPSHVRSNWWCWLPRDYLQSLLFGWGLWCVAGIMLWTHPRVK